MQLLSQLALVAAGSALGGVARWTIGLQVARLLGTKFPYGTLLINVTGCFLIGWVVTFLTLRHPDEAADSPLAKHLHLLLAVGFLGGYTTFSTFGLEADRLIDLGEGWLAFLYLAGSIVLGLLAVRFGIVVARWGG